MAHTTQQLRRAPDDTKQNGNFFSILSIPV